MKNKIYTLDDFTKEENKKDSFNEFKEKIQNKNLTLLSSYDDYINQKKLEFNHTCGETFSFYESDLIECPKCSIEKKRKELLEFISSIYDGKIEQNTSYDIFIPDKQVAIEFNGNYFHSSCILHDKFYHQKKTLEAKEKGIRLIHVFEYEWDNHKDRLKILICSALGIYSKIVFARKCQVKYISYPFYRDFLNLYHLQGSINSSIRYGLFYDDEIVSVIGFGKNRFKKDEMELHRYCVKGGYRVIGGFSKLIKNSEINSFISYIDLGHFTGKGYRAIGFEELSITEPNYKWVKGQKALNRISTQKHKLENFLDTFDKNLSEIENMSNNGYIQVYDCGNIKVRYTKK